MPCFVWPSLEQQCFVRASLEWCTFFPPLLQSNARGALLLLSVSACSSLHLPVVVCCWNFWIPQLLVWFGERGTRFNPCLPVHSQHTVRGLRCWMLDNSMTVSGCSQELPGCEIQLPSILEIWSCYLWLFFFFFLCSAVGIRLNILHPFHLQRLLRYNSILGTWGIA